MQGNVCRVADFLYNVRQRCPPYEMADAASGVLALRQQICEGECCDAVRFAAWDGTDGRPARHSDGQDETRTN